MTIQGIVQNGVVVFPPGAELPEGTVVSVVVVPQQSTTTGARMSEEQRRALLAAMNAIVALPNENPGDTFSGRDHDQVLYGEP